MQSVKRTRRETSRLVLSGILCFLLVGLIGGCDPQLNEKITAINNQLASIDNRVTNIDNSVTEIDNRVTNIDNSITEIDNRVTNIEEASGEEAPGEEAPGEGDPLIYQVDYIFGDFDPAPDRGETRARLRFCGDLQRALTEWSSKRRGFHITPVVAPPPNMAPVWDLLLENCERLVEPERHFGFTLMNAQARSGKPGVSTHQEEIEATIRELAERHEIENLAERKELAVPVRVDPKPAPLRVQKEARVYKATSGVGRAAPGTCQQTVRFDLSGDPKLVNAEIPLVVYTYGGSEPKLHRPEGLVIENVISCGGGKGENYILVVLQEPVVAQYRHLEYEVSIGQGPDETGRVEVKVMKEEQLPVPLIEGAPACPPKGLVVSGAKVDVWAEGPFRNELQKNWQKCSEHAW